MDNTVNRGWLKRQIAAGKMEGKVNYSKYGFNDVGSWMPAIVISHYSDREQGKFCIMEDEFHGCHKAYRDTDGTIRMYNGGDSYSFRELEA